MYLFFFTRLRFIWPLAALLSWNSNPNLLLLYCFIVGTYILTTALIPALKKVEDPRVVGGVGLFHVLWFCWWDWTSSWCLLSGHRVVGRNAHPEAQRRRPPVWEGGVWRHRGLRSEQSEGRPPRQRRMEELRPWWLTGVCVVCPEAAGDPNRKVGHSAQRHPLLLHAPRLGRHSRSQQLFSSIYYFFLIFLILLFIFLLKLFNLNVYIYFEIPFKLLFFIYIFIWI